MHWNHIIMMFWVHLSKHVMICYDVRRTNTSLDESSHMILSLEFPYQYITDPLTVTGAALNSFKDY